MSEDDKNALVGQIIKPENLALLRKQDRFVIMAGGLIVVASLGAAGFLANDELIGLIIGLSMLIVAALVILVVWRGHDLKGLEKAQHDQAAIGQSVNGDWWQIVSSSDHPGLSYIRIDVSGVAGRHALHGVAFNENGDRLARFSSNTIAIKNINPIEIMYFWTGTVYGGEDGNLVYGLGRLRFDTLGHEDKPLEAEGLFTRGTKNEFEFEKARAVELFRFDSQESKQLKKDPSMDTLKSLARDAFVRYKLEAGRRFSVM